jgi:hypothetical protein
MTPRQTDCQSQCDSDSDSRYQSPPATSRYYATMRQQQNYVFSDRRPARGPTTCPASADPARALPTGANLRSAEFTSATADRQPNAEKLGRLPARCLLNPACCCPSGPGNLSYTLRPLSGPSSTIPANQPGPHRGPPHSIRNDPFRATNSCNASILLHSGGAVIDIKAHVVTIPHM